MKAFRKRATGRLAIGLIKVMGAWLRRKPLLKAYGTGEKFGRLIWKVSGKRRERAEANLKLAFPEKSDAERAELAKRTFEHFGRAAVDFIVGVQRTKEDIESNTEFVGLENLEKAVSRGKGTLLITGHIGNWERVSSWLSLAGYPLTVIARDANQDDVNQMVNAMRSGPGTNVVARGNAARPALERLKANEIVGILPDQNASEIFIPFFGHPAGTVLGPGVLNARTKASVLPVYGVYVGDGKWKIVFDELIEPLDGYDVKGEGLMRAINAWLESVIREYPDQWLWFHDRWRNAKKEGLIK